MGVLISLLGAVCMPHNLYLHSALTLTRDIPTDAPPQALKMALFYNKVESAIALLLSLFVNCAVVIVAAYFHDNAKPEDVAAPSRERTRASSSWRACLSCAFPPRFVHFS